MFQLTDMRDLNDLQRDLRKFYDRPADEQFYLFSENDFCVVLFENDWYRSIVRSSNHREKSVKVFLVDFGRCVVVPTSHIRLTTPYFASFPPFTFECRMNPLDTDPKLNDDSLVEKFAQICMKAQFIQLHYLTCEMPYVVRLLVTNYERTVKRNNAFLLSPAYAVLATELVLSDNINWITSNAEHRSDGHCSVSREKVKIIIESLRSPAEIYVSTPHTHAIKRKLQAAIQRWVAHQHLNQRRGDLKRKWREGDACLVLVRRSQNAEIWYRGRIDATDANQLHIFLIDFGDIVCVTASKLMPTDEKLVRCSAGVIKCHMDGVNSWLQSSVCILNSMIGDGYASFGQKINDSVPITLWRPIQATALRHVVEWMNMNRWLVTATVIEATDLYITKSQTLSQPESHPVDNNLHFDLNAISLEDDLNECHIDDVDGNSDQYDESIGYLRLGEIFYELNNWEDGAVDHWLPSVEIHETSFYGTPVHIDEKCVFYIHDSDRTCLAQNISIFITRSIEVDRNAYDASAANWTVGQTCFAKYEDKYYRGVVQCINRGKGECLVKYVDYGNIDSCMIEDMRAATKCGHIPVLARKYYLENVQPMYERNEWSTFMLSVLRTEIVNQMCKIRVKDVADHRDNGILPCTMIRMDGIDVKTRLIDVGLCYELP